jgi:fucokinase
MRPTWDYLIVTASNEAQAKAYRGQLAVRRRLGLLPQFAEVLAIADPQGKRIGSGGSTLFCLLDVLNREIPRGGARADDWAAIEGILGRLRILILHAGGDSKRLPAYGPCGKIFVPLPGQPSTGVGETVFDHLLRVFTPFPATSRRAEGDSPIFADHADSVGMVPDGGRKSGQSPAAGQVVVAAGDALIRFDPSQVRLAASGLTALGCHAAPEEAKKHGVFCAQASGPVRRFLQKPSLAQQALSGALSSQGQAILDVAVMSFGADVAVTMLQAVETGADDQGRLAWSAAMNQTIFTRGLDLYREICCALGSEATADHLVASARSSGSTWDDAMLRGLFARLNPIPFHVQVLPECDFLHFGTTRQLITSGRELLRQMGGLVSKEMPLAINNLLLPGGAIVGSSCWVEGCRLSAPLELAGHNVVVGIDVAAPLSLSEGACLDVIAGQNRSGQPVWFARCYHVSDTFKDSAQAGATFCGRPLLAWLASLSAEPQEIWDATIPAEKRSLWDARVFPAVEKPGDYRDWLWMLGPAPPTGTQRQAFLAVDRYSAAEVALLADQEAWVSRRMELARQAEVLR